ncbi:2-hydroxyacid dehydrogenase [Belliella kenyensis]|uniref:2-hydroxyacid dehydrogenase n=1 Tax=Belliella kenyensis TaxID=1472724 RepID=A0ABV8EGI5_9BACT|nr:glyoxylate/hydroxypyruvate reductase A [Belliella kenyensis]MCH7401926.1 glyoxylate/hydroxypyruvate reductase A [Belliella kenyensis]MDN3604426.1 glyoxylate/hydroxypyruvate reductase A [Belliella kenyensis]
MGIVIISPNRSTDVWESEIRKIDPNIDIQVFPNIERYEDVSVALLWNHPTGLLSKFPNLKLICSMGAGVDHILADDTISDNLPITRIVDPKLTFSMSNFVIMGVLNYHRQWPRYQKQQVEQKWDMSQPEIPIHIGVLGVGELGGDLIRKLQALDLKVAGYGNSVKEGLSYPYYHGGQLQDFLDQINVIVCLLPLTPDTEKFLNKDFFLKCKKGTYLINVARGKHLVEADLIDALDQGQLSGALLDVFLEEPLPQQHPFWRHDKIQVTPHIASVTNPKAAVPQIVNNYHNILNQQPLTNQIDRARGY